MTDQSQQKIPRWLGPLVVVIAVLIAIFGEESTGANRWVGYMACGAFMLGGIGITAQAFGLTRLAKAVAPLIVAAMAVMATWIAFGPGERECGISLSFVGFRGSDLGCRIGFAISAALTWMIFAAILWFSYFRKSRRSTDPSPEP